MASSARSISNVAEGMAPRKMFMRLHLLKGKFLPDDTEAAMDPAVWSRMPEDLVWRVVLLLPAVKLLQLQLVSRHWRQVLTSADFRMKFMATAAAVGAAQERSVIGCVMCEVSVGSDGNGGSRGSKKVKHMDIDLCKKVKHVDIDLSFVPAWFWKSDSYTVKAAADGLVCISNLTGNLSFTEGKEFCVVNPLTRTCKMLPEIPFWPWEWLESSGPLTIVTIQQDGNMDWMVATCDLGEGAGWTVVGGFKRQGLGLEHFAVCAGETYMFCDGRMHVKCTAAEGGSRGTVTFDGPGLLDLDWLFSPYSLDRKRVKLVTHRESVFLVAHLVELRPGPAMVCGVWRLVRSLMKWEAVAGLELEEMHRLTGFRYARWQGPCLLHAQCAGNLLCCTLGFECGEYVGSGNDLRIVLGLSLETGTWEVLYVHRSDGYEQLLELRPDIFLF